MTSEQLLDIARNAFARDAHSVAVYLVDRVLLLPNTEEFEPWSAKRKHLSAFEPEIAAVRQTLITIYDFAQGGTGDEVSYGTLIAFLVMLRDANTSIPFLSSDEKESIDTCWRACELAAARWND